MTYEAELKNNKKFLGNVIILLSGSYYGIRQPDSGLTLDDDKKNLVQSVIINPTTVDVRRVNTTIASISFRLLDKSKNGESAITKLFKDSENLLIDQEVRIWIGRSRVNLDFSDYYELPKTFIQSIDHNDNSYNFKATDTTERINKPAFDQKTVLTGAMTELSTSAAVLNTDDFPASGLVIIDNELISYTSKTSNTLNGLTRGEFSTTPDSHKIGRDLFLAERISDNPLNILLQMLISGGGGGVYDVLNDGLGIDNNLIDIALIESIRDEFFVGETYVLYVYNLSSVLKFIEKEILGSCNLRLITTNDQKIGVTLLDQSTFDEASDNPINENTISSHPKWIVQKNMIVNSVEINYDFNEDTKIYEQQYKDQDQDSITAYGKQSTLKYDWKGIRQSLSGATIAAERATRILSRFSTPTPQISFRTHIDKSLLNVGDKVSVTSRMIPNASGTLNFADSLEVISRSINYITGDVVFKLQYTSYAGIRGAYISPCTSIIGVNSQSEIVLPSGRGDAYEVGWKLKLYNKTTNNYESDPVNTIASINGDIITFENNWTTTLNTTDFVIRFANYDEVSNDQRKYAFVGIAGGGDFADGSSPYKILL